jgi:hypothetical protein
VDGQEFADVEAYGVEWWLGELALALRKETYRPEPIERVFIPKANGKLEAVRSPEGDRHARRRLRDSSGSRKINARQAKALAKRFGVSPVVFL